MRRSVAAPLFVLIATSMMLALAAGRTPAASAAAPGWEVHQITNNAYDDLGPVVGDGLVVWTADPGGTGDHDVFWLRLGEQTVNRIEFTGDDWDVATAQGRIAWVHYSADPGPDGWHYEVWLLDANEGGGFPQMLDGAATSEAAPTFGGSRVFWAGKGVGGTDIFLYDAAMGPPRVNVSGSLPSGAAYEYYPQTDGDLVAWDAEMGPGQTGEVVAYDLVTHAFTRVTDNAGNDFSPVVAGSRVVYFDNETAEVYLYDTARPADGSVLLTPGPGFSTNPRISSRGAVFATNDSGWAVQLHRFDTGQLMTLTDGSLGVSSDEPAVGDGLIAWAGSPAIGDGNDIYVASFPGLVPVNLSARVGMDQEPFVADGMVVWEGSVGGTQEIFFARDLGAGEPTFTDVAAGHPYYQAIEGMAAEGIINGYDMGGGAFEFRPGNNLLRAQFAKIIVGAMDLPVTEQTPLPPFTDLGADKQDDLYPHEYVAAAFENGITYGTTATTFGPYKDITRAQLLSMVVRALQTLRPGSLSAPPAGWTGQLPSGDPNHGGNIRLAEYNGLLDGVSLTGWDIWAKANRGEAAQILWNLTQLEQ